MGALAVPAIALGYAAAGLAILIGLGLVRDRADALVLSGLAVVTGWAATGVWLSLVLVVGADVTPVTVLVGWFGLVAGAAALTRVVRAGPRLQLVVPAGRKRLALLGATIVVALAAVLVLARAVFWTGLFHADVWSFWIPKAKTIYFFAGLDTAPGGFTSQVSPDYPPLKPAVDAAVFALAGDADPLLLPPHNAVLAVAFVAAAAAVLWRLAGAMVAAAGALVVLALPGFRDLAGSSLADESLAILFAVACLLGADWLLAGDPRPLALVSLLLGACVLTKNEGALLAAALLAALAAVAPLRRHAALAAVGPATVFVTWRAWLVANDVPRNPAQRFERLAEPRYLAQHFDQFAYGSRRLAEEVSDPRLWSAAVPLVLLVAIALVGTRTRLAVVAAGVPLACLAGFAVIYWIGPNRIFEFEPEYTFIEDNVRRVVAPVALASAAVLPLLVREAVRPPSRHYDRSRT